MRILIVNRGIFRVPPESSGGGAEKHGYYLANHLAKLGHEVCFVSKTRTGLEHDPNVNVQFVPPRRAVIPPQTMFFGWIMKHLFGNILSFLVALRTLAKEHFRFHVVHCHGALAALLLSKLIGWRIPVVYTMHDASPWVVSYPGIHRRAFRKLAYLIVDVQCLRSVRHVIAVSPALRDEARRWGASKVTFIPNGVRTPSGQERSPSDIQYGLCVGQLAPRKRIDLLVKAASELAEDNFRFVVVGDGPERTRLVRLAESLGVKDRILFTGYVDDQELARYYAGASFFVFPSTAESFGIATFEAMAYGLPAVVSRLRVYEGIISDEDALLFEPGNLSQFVKCINLLVSNTELRQKLSSQAILLSSKFSWEAVAEQVHLVYQVASLQRTTWCGATTNVRQDSKEAILTRITDEISSHTPALAVYLVGSMARGFGGYAKDYDVIVVLKSQLLPTYLRRLKTIGRRLSSESGSKVEVNPLSTCRLRKARGSLFLMKAREEAKLLCGMDVLRHVNTGDWRDISVDWYFSFVSSLLKDLLGEYASSDPMALRGITQKIANSLIWLSGHSEEHLSKLVSACVDDLLNLVSSSEVTWLDIRDRMLTLFRDMAAKLLHTMSANLEMQTDALLRTSKGKSATKNLEYGILLLMIKGEVASLRRILSRTLIQDRYRAALVLLLEAASNECYDPNLIFKAYSILRGCLKVKRSNRPEELWRSMRVAILDYWNLAQSVMGL